VEEEIINSPDYFTSIFAAGAMEDDAQSGKPRPIQRLQIDERKNQLSEG
jgi:hypothetical protein